jgi:hypothetical protein
MTTRSDHDPDDLIPDTILFDLEKQWEVVRRLVYLPGVSAVQLQECKRAFYAGAAAVISVQMRICDDDISDQRAAEVLDSLLEQARQFNEKLRLGLA